jgi:transposase-like protein
MGLVQRLVRGAGYFVGESAKPLSGRYLSFAEREEIALLRAQRYTIQEVARRLGRAPSTISRELRRNAATRNGGLEYRATTAQWHAERAARRPKQAKLALNAALQAYVEERLAGVVIAPSGAPVPGPAVSWKGRRHGPRQDWRWATAWSPWSRSPAACRSTFRTMRPCASALLDRERPHHTMRPGPAADSRSRPIGDRTHEAARVLRRRAIAPGRPRTFMIRPVVS